MLAATVVIEQQGQSPWTTAFPPILGVVGVLIGALIVRASEIRRQVRDMRRPTYVAWLRVARSLVPLDVPPPAGGKLEVPPPAWKQRLNDFTAELEIIGSRDVRVAANRYLDRLTSNEIRDGMKGPWKQPAEAVDAFEALMADARKEVAAAMRRELGTR